MRSSNNFRAWLWLCALTGTLTADEVILDGGARLTGTVRSLNEAGLLELASPLAPAPVVVKAAAVEKVTFSNKGATPKLPPAIVELSNGDMLPINLEALDDTKLAASSPEAGRLEIPRTSLKALMLGISQRHVVYAGPRSIEEWSGNEGELKNWAFENDKLIANGPATAAKKLDLPEQFILRFTLDWQPRQIPNFQVFFADSLKPRGEPSDRYYLQFGGAGLEIKREAAKGRRWTTIVQLNRNPSQYPDHELLVELRVDRKGSRIQLLLNGEPEGEWVDPIPTVPPGSGITLVCNAPNGIPQEIRAIEVLEFDNAPSRHHAEDRGDSKTDSMISREDDRWGGKLVEIKAQGDSRVFRFKSTFQDEIVEIPEADVSTVFFAATSSNNNAAAPDGEPKSLVLRLRGQGSLHLDSCQFNEESITGRHPLLGTITLRRDGVTAMERSQSKPASKP